MVPILLLHPPASDWHASGCTLVCKLCASHGPNKGSGTSQRVHDMRSSQKEPLLPSALKIAEDHTLTQDNPRL